MYSFDNFFNENAVNEMFLLSPGYGIVGCHGTDFPQLADDPISKGISLLKMLTRNKYFQPE